MVYPTSRGILLAAAGAPLTLGLVALSPGMWTLGLGWIAFVLGLLAVDAVLSPWPSALQLSADFPDRLYVGRADNVSIAIRFNGRRADAVETRLEADARLDAAPMTADRYRLWPKRRGLAALHRLWLRWKGPLGLIWKQHAAPLGRQIAIVPDSRTVAKEALRLFSPDRAIGTKVQLDSGESAEFEALREFHSGMDRRAIDWKQTARHRKLLSREFRIETNHPVVMAMDTGRLMCEPVGNKIAKLDQALNAALLMSYVSLKHGDQVGFYAFDSAPRLNTGMVTGARAFRGLQEMTAGIDYSDAETNYTLGLTQLSARLDRRSLVVVFTDFADSTSAELMLNNMARILKRHLVIFIAFRDEELEAMLDETPDDADDISRAVIADTLLRERDVVLTRLQRMGALIVDAPSDQVGVNLVNEYLRVKRRNLL